MEQTLRGTGSSGKSIENEEVRKILKELTALVLLQEDEVIHNNKVIGYLDFVNAKALYALANNHVIASISDKQELHLIEAKHPLLNDFDSPFSFDVDLYANR